MDVDCPTTRSYSQSSWMCIVILQHKHFFLFHMPILKLQYSNYNQHSNSNQTSYILSHYKTSTPVSSLTNYMHQGPSQEANSQATPRCTVWKLKVHYYLHKAHCQPPAWDREIQFKPSLPISLRNSSILSSHIWFGLPSGLQVSPYVPHFAPISSFQIWSPI